MNDQNKEDYSPGELVAQGEALIRIENETMLRVAKERPRNEHKVLEGALAELDLVPEEASKAYYSIPYKDKQPDGTVKITKVEGPSIKSAMALARRWGNCTVGARMLAEDDSGYDLEGVMIDLESDFRVSRPFRVSKWFRTKAGQVVKLQVDRQMMSFQAGVSKAMRNAILAALPAYLVSAYFNKAKLIVGGKQDVLAEPKIIQACVSAFEKIGVKQDVLQRYTGHPPEGWTGDIVAELRGIYNAIQDQQTTVAEVFTEPEEELKVPQALDKTDVPKPITPDQTTQKADVIDWEHKVADILSDLEKINTVTDILRWKETVLPTLAEAPENLRKALELAVNNKINRLSAKPKR